jgi:glutathione S-transferase
MHSSPRVLLFGLERSVYTRIARLALEEKGVPYLMREVEIFGPDGVPADHFQRHPFGRIPVLQHDAFFLYETGAIAQYVDEAFAGPALQPIDPKQRARMRQVIGVLDSYAYRPMVWGVFVQRVSVPLSGGTPDEAEIASSLKLSAICLGALNDLLGTAPYFAGGFVSLADLHAFPTLHYFCLAPEGRAMFQQYASLSRWYEIMLARPSIRSTAGRYEVRKE